MNFGALLIIFSLLIEANHSHCSKSKLLKKQDQNRIKKYWKSNLDLTQLTLRKKIDLFYEMSSHPLQNYCQVIKRFGGVWYEKCGYLDGEKLLCMDKLYAAVKNKSCLIYSFGLGTHWHFEEAMAEMGNIFTAAFLFAHILALGCQVHAYDPAIDVSLVTHPRLHFHRAFLNVTTNTCMSIPYYSLDRLIKDNGDEGKKITYLKLDIEHQERPVLTDWLESDVLDNIEQIGVEMHTGHIDIDQWSWTKLNDMFSSGLNILTGLFGTGFRLVGHNPNGCMNVKYSHQQRYYSYFDVLLVK